MVHMIDSNAATRYLYAIAWLKDSNISSFERDQFAQFSRGEIVFSQLSDEAKRFLRNRNSFYAIDALIKGSLLTFCNFCPDYPNYNSKAFPPGTEIVRLADFSLALGEYNALRRRYKSAIEIGIACIVFGAHIAQYSDASIFMLGVRVSKKAISFLSRFVAIRPHWKKEIQERIGIIPRPLFSARNAIIAEKKNLLMHLNEIEGILKPNSYLRQAFKAVYSREKFPGIVMNLSTWVNSVEYSLDKRLLIEYLDSSISYEQNPSQYASNEKEFKLLFSKIDKNVGHGPIWDKLLQLYKFQADIENQFSEICDK